ncbi:hypothetical protein A3736_05770 [Erythrobacter sp. HI0063]|nr:hypothetical protein A3736_05770 [Erythrobacter sp. HI0063]
MSGRLRRQDLFVERREIANKGFLLPVRLVAGAHTNGPNSFLLRLILSANIFLADRFHFIVEGCDAGKTGGHPKV